jgi:hypothetical protein
MGHELSRRLSIVVPYLYPDLVNKPFVGDYYLKNDGTRKGTYVVWLREDIPAPTDEELAAAKEDAVNDFWWKTFRAKYGDQPVTKPPYEELIAQLNIQDGQDELASS